MTWLINTNILGKRTKTVVCVKPFNNKEMLKQFGIALIDDKGKIMTLRKNRKIQIKQCCVMPHICIKRDSAAF